MKKTASKLFALVLLAPALLPLIYVGGLLYSYLVPKTLLFRGFGLVALALFSYLVFSGGPFFWARLRQKLSWIPGALLFVAYGTSFLGVDFYRSFWSTFDRGDGLLTLSIAVIFFYLILLYSDQKFSTRLVKVISLAGTIIALYAFLQWAEIILGINLPLIAETERRLGGTFGNAAFLASFLGLSSLITFLQARESLTKYRLFIYLAGVFQIIVVFLNATRGTILALLVAGFLTLILFSLKGKKNKIRIWARGAILAFLVMAGLFFVFRAQLAKSTFDPIRRMASISISDNTVSSRLFVWQGVFGEAIKKPLTGYGAEHIDILFNRVYNPDSIIEQWFDRSHNAYLDYFAQYGIFGLLLYFGIIISLALTGLRMWKGGDGRGKYFILITVVYAIQNFFIFDTALTLWLIFVLSAIALSLSSSAKPLSIPLFSYSYLVGGALALVLFVLVIPVSLTPLRANLFLSEGYRDHISNVKEAVSSMEKGLFLKTYADVEYGYQAYVMYTERQVRLLSGEDRVLAYKYALEILSDNFKRYPYDARTGSYLAHVIDLAPPEVKRDDGLLSQVLTEVIKLSPKRTQPWFLRANIFIREGNSLGGEGKLQSYKKAISTLEEYANLVSKNAEARYIIANLYLSIGDKTMAIEWAKNGLLLYTGRLDAARQAWLYYRDIKDWQSAIPFMEDIVRGMPTDYESIYYLAKLYFMTDKKEMSLKLIERLRKEKPEILQTDPEFLRAIGQ